MPPALQLRGPRHSGAGISMILAIGVILWIAVMPLGGAIRASGDVASERVRHPVQHPDGGVVARLVAAEGQRVAAGEPLIHLETQTLSAELTFVIAQRAEAEARLARLAAERSATDMPAAPHDVRAEVLAALDTQGRLLSARRAEAAGEVEQFHRRRAQLVVERDGVLHQLAAKDAELALVTAALATQTALAERGLIADARVTDLARDSARGLVVRAEFEARLAAIDARRDELDAQIAARAAQRALMIEEAFVEAQMHALDRAARAEQLRERLAASILRAPVAGIVQGLTLRSAGAVLRPGEAALHIIAPDTAPHISLRARPDDIDHLHPGQTATFSLPAMAARDLPTLEGHIAAISPAPFTDDRTGAQYFGVTLVPSAQALAALDGRPLVPGMTVEAFVATRPRTAIEYLLPPLTRHLSRALREP